MSNKPIAIVVSSLALCAAGLGVVYMQERGKEPGLPRQGTSSVPIEVETDPGPLREPEAGPDPTPVTTQDTVPDGPTRPRSRSFTEAMSEVSGLADARRDANESAAMATLRSFAAAQAMVQAMGIVDSDNDGIGEYGFLGELSGGVPVRVAGPANSVAVGNQVIEPAILSPSFQAVQPGGIVERLGYYYRVFLPTDSGDGRSSAMPEPVGVEANGLEFPNANACERGWCAYAWPKDAGREGTQVFFIRHEGVLFANPNRDLRYSGTDRAPAFDAAFPPDHGEDWFATPIEPGAVATDGTIWSVIP